MRLVSFNLWSGRSQDDRLVDPERLAAVIAELDPDVLGLQEVDVNQARSHGADQTAAAAAVMGATAHRFAAALDGTPGGHWVSIAGEPVADHPLYGVALLSRFPVRSWDLLRLPGIGPHFPLPVPTLRRSLRAARRSVLIGEEPRVALIAELETPLGIVAVASTHLSVLPAQNVAQLRLVTRRMAHYPDPAVIMGDLNLPAPVPARTTGYRSLARHRTFPAKSPRLQLDHILLRGDLGPVRRSEAVRMAVSDHRALVVDVG